jgi:uncharacterized repeat protein (TIGR01451 family)
MILIFFCCFVNADGEQISGIGGPIVSVNENGESGNAAAQLSIELYQETGAGATVNPGDFARFTIKYKNISSSGLLFVEIRFFLPASPLFTYSSISGGTYNAADNSISWSKFFLSSGSSGTYVVEGKWGRLGAFSHYPGSNYVSSGSSSNSYTPSARITALFATTETVEGGSINIIQFCGLSLPEGSNYFRQGDDKVIYYPMTISNTGNIYDNFTLTVPAEVLAPSGNKLKLRIVDINHNLITQSGWIGPNGVFVFFIELDGTVPNQKPVAGDIFHTVITARSSVCSDVATGNLTTTTYNGGMIGPDIVVYEYASSASFTVGSGTLTYTILLTNSGDTNASGVELKDYLPVNGQSAPSAISPAASSVSGSNPAGWVVTWQNISLVVNQTKSFTFTISPNCNSIPALSNTATATVAGEIFPGNNTSTIITPVLTDINGPILTSDKSNICYDDQVTISVVNPPAGTQYRWYNSPTGLIPVFSGGSSYSTTLQQTATFYVSIYNPSTLCESNRSSITIIVDNLAATPSNQSICTGEATSLSLSANDEDAVFTWTASVTVIPPGGNITGQSDCTSNCGNTISQALINTGNTPGTVTYTVVPAENGCSGAPAAMIITIYPPPAASPIYHR